MKLSDYEEFETLVVSLREAEAEIKTVEGSDLGVTFNGRYQGEEVTNCVRPVILKLLDTKRRDVLRKIEALGVEVVPEWRQRLEDQGARSTLGDPVEKPAHCTFPNCRCAGVLSNDEDCAAPRQCVPLHHCPLKKPALCTFPKCHCERHEQ